MRDEQAIAAKRVATRRAKELAAGFPECKGESCTSLVRTQKESGLCTACDKEARKVYMAQYRRDNFEHISGQQRLRSGLRRSECDAMKEAAGACEICGGATDVVDHNHATGFARGVLCHYCNTRLGMLEAPDFESWRLNAMVYLAKYDG